MDEARFLRLISRSDPSLDERAMRGALFVASKLYAVSVGIRNSLFDCGWKKSYSVEACVISIGNLTTGGTGKTPLVAYVVEQLKQRGLQLGIVSRGYHAIGAVNDEKLVLDRLCPAVPHVQDRDRVAVARRLLREQRVDVLVADDAFQHRRLKRDLDVVLIDALNSWGYGGLLPRGLMREPKKSLRRADVVVLTRVNQVDEATRQSIWNEVNRYRPGTEPIEVAFEARALRRGAECISLRGGPNSEPSKELAELKAFSFCGIGNPSAFEASLRQLGINVVGSRAFPDHHHYSERDLADLERAADRTGATAFVATLKDLVKLPTESIGERPVWCLDIAAHVMTGQSQLDAAFEKVVARCRRATDGVSTSRGAE